MILFMMGARNATGRNPRPAIHRPGLRISRTCEASDRSMSVPSTGVAQPKDSGLGGDVKGEIRDSGYRAGAPEVEVALETGPVHRNWLDAVHAVVAMDVAKVAQIH